jgi:hypothetical protein
VRAAGHGGERPKPLIDDGPPSGSSVRQKAASRATPNWCSIPANASLLDIVDNVLSKGVAV